MLKILNKGVCALAVATSFMATSVQAEDQTVLIMDNGYFPAVIYVGQGDNIIFTNNSDASHTLAGPGDVWVSEPIAVDGTYVLSITEETPATYSGASSTGEIIEGSFTYE